jgi:hypothetical protein
MNKNDIRSDAGDQNPGTDNGADSLWEENFTTLDNLDDKSSSAQSEKGDEGETELFFRSLPTPGEEEKSQNEEEEESGKEGEESDPSNEEKPAEDDKKTKKDLNKSTESKEDESEIVTPFFDLFQEELGWEVEDENKPKTVGELVDYIQDLVEANTANNFADSTVAELNEYVKNGGDPYTFFRETYGRTGDLDLESVDISDVKAQRQLVSENLRAKGYSNDRIQKTLSRYEDSGILEEEAEDALGELKETIELQKEQLVRQQQAEAERQRQEEIQFFQGVQGEIGKLDAIRGIPVTRAERDQLLRYIFQRDRDGLSPYQRDYYKNLSKNLIESAYFTMKGDKFVEKIKNKEQTSAAQALREKLRSRSSLGKNSQVTEKNLSDSAIWDTVANQLKPR